MRGATRAGLTATALALLLSGCDGRVDGDRASAAPAASVHSGVERAARRAFDGAPPTVPHDDFAMTCTECHNREGREVEGVGFSPPTPHEETHGISAISRCRQCHVFRLTETAWRESSFKGAPQDLRSGERSHFAAPPVMPHAVFMRENCIACHSGPAAREEIRTSHPERARCRQCHVERVATTAFNP